MSKTGSPTGCSAVAIQNSNIDNTIPNNSVLTYSTTSLCFNTLTSSATLYNFTGFNNTLLEKEEYLDVIEWLSSIDKKQITNKLKDFSKYGNDFKVNVSKCSNSQCTMKDSKVDMTSEDLMTRIISSVVKNLST
jgi:hypothetical protein